MKNSKKIAIVLSLTAAIGIGSFAYASDFSGPLETNENIEDFGGHCYGRHHRGPRHGGHHRHHRHNEMRHRG